MALPARQGMLRSVFPSAPLAVIAPTPQATPLLGQSSFSNAQATSVEPNSQVEHDPAAETLRWENCWHAATTFLVEQLKPNPTIKTLKDCPRDVQDAIRYVRSPKSVGYRLRKNSQADDLIWWYSQVIQLLFLKQQLPPMKDLYDLIGGGAASWHAFRRSLVDCRAFLLGPYREFLVPLIDVRWSSQTAPVEENYKALVIQSFSAALEPKLLDLIISTATRTLGVSCEATAVEDSMEGIENTDGTEAKALLLQTLSGMVNGGLSAPWLERVLAQGLDKTMCRFVTSTFTRRWDSPSNCVDELKEWVARPFVGLCSRALESIAQYSLGTQRSPALISQNHIVDWQRRAVDELGRLRLSELFDIVVEWDNGSKGGIEDLRHYLNSPTRRTHVITTFTEVLSYRLLIPGASTTEILQMYMRMIRAFALVDLKFVVLERIGRPIRRYLRDRDDTVRIIVTGLLADPEDPTPPGDALVELAVELHEMDEIAANDDDVDLDWDDMKWQPNPADAEPDFKKTKNLDVVGNLISLFDNKEIFVREFQNILGERLLGASVEFDREIRVLELLKSRFGDAALQSCEVMLKDIFDSRRTDIHIKKEQNIPSADDEQPEIYTKVLSRFFWPSLRGDEFKVPSSVQTLHESYSTGFEEYKMKRKLAWLPALGQATVELQLKYRTVSELVTTWQASVISAFSSDDDGGDSPKKTTAQLVEELEMDEDLVSNALTFWVSKLVLYEPQPGTYEVLEVLPTEEDVDSAAGDQKASADIVAAAQSASAAAAASAASAVRSEEELAEEKMEVVWQYVVGMLTNQGSMPLQQMVMMLNFVVPGGFTHSNEEFRGFLQRRVDDGRLEMAGASYKIPKKGSSSELGAAQVTRT